MATDNDVYELTHAQTMFGIEVDNIYFYQRGTGITAGAQALAEEFQEQVLPSILALQPSEVKTGALYVRNLFDETDTYNLLLTEEGGLMAADVLPPHDAINFTLGRTNATTRNGSKRIAGIQEAAQDDGIISGGGILSLLAAGADAMGEVILGTLSAEWFFPVIVGRILTGSTYRLPESAAEAVVNAVLDVIFNPDVSTQTSRKYGNGA